MDVFIGNFVGILLVLVYNTHPSEAMSRREKQELKAKASEMFQHAYRSYMDHAYPADELMPLSCKGRYRGTHPSRGDIDDALGNFSLTLIDTLDTLVVLGEVDEFETAVRHVINDINFDSDIVVSVFETNIRVVGGLLGGHLMADFLKQKKKRMPWYNNELLKMAQDLGDRLLPAFNTSTGMPYPRVNLRYGVKHENSRTGSEKDTCTACAGTMLLEFSALSRLTGNKIYEDKAAQAMDYLWESRHRTSDLVGTVINIHNGDWVRRESGIGAGIDSYYEYLLKGYIMLGKDTYLERFNKHYKAVMKYISNGPLMLDVHMHRPQMNSRNFMDALLAFWPGLQVLKGDLKSAIEIHEMLYQVTLRHNFLPEAFTADFRVHWGQHPLRPEFLESTYFIYKATGDPYYLEVGKSVIENLNRHARVNCGFAALKDVTTGSHEDQMDSYVLAETFKYLYLLFSEKEDLILNVDDYVFTTEAHLLPLFLSSPNSAQNLTEDSDNSSEESRPGVDEEEYDFRNTCPSTSHLFKGKIDFAHHLRSPLKNMVENLCPKPKSSESPRLKASEFIAGNKDQVALLNRMGIRIITMTDGRVQLLHLANEAASPEDSSDGLLFMQEMVELSKAQASDAPLEPRVVQLMSPPYFGSVILKAGPAQFGVNLKNHPGIEGPLVVASPLRCCQPLSNSGEVSGKFVMVERGDCMFVDKARHLQNAGAIGAIIFDNNSQSSADSSPLFSMSGDGKADVIIPLVFLFRAEAKAIQEALTDHPELIVYVSERHKRPEDVLLQYLSYQSRSLTLESQRSRGSADISSSSNAESESLSGSQTEKADSDLEASIRGLIVLLLRRINLERLEPFVRRRSREKLDSRVAGSFPVRLIRMPVDSPDRGVRVEFGSDEETQHVVRIVFTEFLMLVLECTNLRQLRSLNQVVDALARLTESVFTAGRMDFGVHTETTLDEIRSRLVVKASCSTSRPAVPDATAEQDATVKSSSRDGSHSASQDDVDAKVDFAGGDVDAEFEQRKRLVHRFLEDQFGIVPGGLASSSTPEESSDGSHTRSQDPPHESGEKSVFLDGPPLGGPHSLQDDDRLGIIQHQFNFVPEEKPETAEQVSSDGVDDVAICDPDTVVDDVSKVKISDITGEPIWQDSHGMTWKHRDGCWRKERKGINGKIENVETGESGANEADGARSDHPKRISGDGVTDGNSPWDSTEGESYTISESDEEIIVEYNAQMSDLEQRLRSSDNPEDGIKIHLESNLFTDQIIYDHDTFEMLRRRELATEEDEEEGENFQFWEMGLGKEHVEKDAERRGLDGAQAHVLETQAHEKIPIPVPNAVSGEESVVPNEDTDSPELTPVWSAREDTTVPNSERLAPALRRPETDGAATENFAPSDSTLENDSEAGDLMRTRN